MSKLYIGFSTTNGLLSWLIRKASGTNFSHTFISFHSGILGGDMVCHAAHGFVHFLNYEKFKKHAKVVEIYEFDISLADRFTVMKYCLDKAGSKYGFTTLFGIAIKLLLKRFNVNVANPFADGPNSYICSEMVNDICNLLDSESRKLFINAEENGMKAIRDRVKKMHEVKRGLSK